MTITEQPPAIAAGRRPGACRYPGCPNPARDPGSPGRRPGYCDQEAPEDRDGTAVLVRHTALTAFRRRQQLSGQPDDGGRPVTAAISRAGSIRDDALAAMSRLGAQLTAALDQLAALGDQLAAAGPEAAELDAAEARTAAAEAIAMLEEHAAARQRAEDQRDAHATELAAARDAARRCEQERERHDDALAALRGQLARAEAALDRERDRQHETTVLLRGLIAGPETSAPKAGSRRQPAAQ